MKKNAFIMGMPVCIEIVDKVVKAKDIEEVFNYFKFIDDTFSTFKKDSDIEKINRGELKIEDASKITKKILLLCKQTKRKTNGYFNININGKLDPSGLVKGYAIWEGAKKLHKKGYKNFYVEIAGDIQLFGKNNKNLSWKIGIENPFNRKEIVKVVYLTNKGIATSGSYINKDHIYDPILKKIAKDVMSITVIGPNVYEADRFVTASYAMGQKGIQFIENLNSFEGYMITNEGKAIYTSGFEEFLN